MLRLLGAVAIAASAATAQAHDYPTSERVVYVESCMRDHPGGHYEMLNKCSCVLDTIARELSYDDYVEMTTALNANTIGGEAGAVIRDAPMLQDQIKQFKAVQAKAQKSCFIQ
jgi:hypothetical protein